MANEKNYWIGNGVFTFDGKQICNGEEIPKGVPSSVIKRYKGLKMIGQIAKPVSGLEPVQKLKYKIDDLQTENDALKAENDNLTKELEELKKQVQESEESK